MSEVVSRSALIWISRISHTLKMDHPTGKRIRDSIWNTRTRIWNGFHVLLFPVKAVAALPLMLAVALVSPYRKVRFGHVGLVNHVGWISQFAETYLREWQLNGRPARTAVILLMYRPDNQPLMDMFKREVRVIQSEWFNRYADFIAPVMKVLGIFLYDHLRYFDHKRYTLTAPVVHLTKDDHRRGREALEAMGVGASDWYACFHTRDSLHYTCDIHDYRNSSIANCIPAMRKVTARGGFAIRVGATVAEPLGETGDRRIVDYATKHRSEFMDVYLTGTNKFFFGTTAGIICVPCLFNRPVAMANAVTPSVVATPFRRDDPYIMKLYRERGGRILTFAEMLEIGLFARDFSSESFVDLLNRNGLACVENTADEVADMCEDMFDILEGRNPAPEVRRLQLLFRDRFLGPLPDKDFTPLLSPRFALRHAALIEG